jgi:hypothetical protein
MRLAGALVRSEWGTGSGQLLGGQLLGSCGAEVSKRIDVLAAAIHNANAVAELADLDLSYTPPLGSPWDASSRPPTPGRPRRRSLWRARVSAEGARRSAAVSRPIGQCPARWPRPRRSSPRNTPGADAAHQRHVCRWSRRPAGARHDRVGAGRKPVHQMSASASVGPRDAGCGEPRGHRLRAFRTPRSRASRTLATITTHRVRRPGMIAPVPQRLDARRRGREQRPAVHIVGQEPRWPGGDPRRVSHRGSARTWAPELPPPTTTTRWPANSPGRRSCAACS